MEKHELDRGDWEDLYFLLSRYIDDVSRKVIVLKHVEMDSFRFLRYRHRFLKRELKKVLDRYNRVFDNASRSYDVGVFLTLTMNPSCYSNLYQASQRISECLNRFLSFLSKRYGKRLDYISVLEPQDSGNPHLHVIVFGIPRIEDHRKLTHILVKQRFGYIHYEYGIRKDENGNWVWRNPANKPKTNTMDVKAYLRKYLTKVFHRALSDSPQGHGQGLRLSDYKLAFYFASNKRFFTCSRALMVKHEKFPCSLWVYVGSWDWLDVPHWILELANVNLVPSTVYTWTVLSF